MGQSIDEPELRAEQPMDRQPPIVKPGHGLDRGERRLEDEPGGQLVRRDLYTHHRPHRDLHGPRRPKRAPKQDDPFWWDKAGPLKLIIGTKRVLVESLFRRRALAAPIATVIEEEHRQTESVQFPQIFEPMNDIARVPV